VNEVYARAKLNLKGADDSNQALEALLEDIRVAMVRVIGLSETARVKVQRWYPGVVEEITEEVAERSSRNITQRLLNEASSALERKQNLQTNATQEKSVTELMGQDVEKGGESDAAAAPAAAASSGNAAEVRFAGMSTIGELPKPRRRVRQKMRSTPVVGGGLFGEQIEAKSGREGTKNSRISHLMGGNKKDDMDWSLSAKVGFPAEINVKGESYNIRISRDTFRDLQKGISGQMVDNRGIEISGVNIAASDDAPIVQRLKGFVRNMPLNKIEESMDEVSVSEISGDDH
jgi:hypothetical protein